MIIAEIVTIVFLILKLTSVVTWSWLWIFSPMIIVYGSLLLFALVWGLFIGGLAGVIRVFDKLGEIKFNKVFKKKK